MVKKLLSYFNKELKFYEGIKFVDNQSNQDIAGSCRRYLQMCKIDESAPCVGREIRIIGEFDDENVDMPVVSYESPVLIIDCDEILKLRFPVYYEQGNTENN